MDGVGVEGRSGDIASGVAGFAGVLLFSSVQQRVQGTACSTLMESGMRDWASARAMTQRDAGHFVGREELGFEREVMQRWF